MPEHKTIAAALATAQLSMGKALKDTTNPHFKSKYADLASVMDACMKALNENGIAVIQPIHETELGRYVVTRFIHTSGESLETIVPLILGKNDMQGLGSAITYARRYGLMGLAGIAPEDDDGNAAVTSTDMRPPNRSWAQTIIDELPPSATDKEKADAVTDALLAQWKRKKTEGELVNEWGRRKALIADFEKRFPDNYRRIMDGYETRMMEVTDNFASKDHAA